MKNRRTSLQRGVFSCYEPIGAERTDCRQRRNYAMTTGWNSCGLLTRIAKRLSSATAITICRRTDRPTGPIRISSAPICPNYAQKIRELVGGEESSLIITEIYVPRPDLPDFLAQAADLLRSNRTTVIYGTVRLIEKDDESFLAWAKQSYACIIFNLLTFHTPSRHRSVGAFVPRLDRSSDRSRWELLPDLS